MKQRRMNSLHQDGKWDGGIVSTGGDVAQEAISTLKSSQQNESEPKLPNSNFFPFPSSAQQQ